MLVIKLEKNKFAINKYKHWTLFLSGEFTDSVLFSKMKLFLLVLTFAGGCILAVERDLMFGQFGTNPSTDKAEKLEPFPKEQQVSKETSVIQGNCESHRTKSSNTLNPNAKEWYPRDWPQEHIGKKKMTNKNKIPPILRT